jgi:hypothetical protein
MPKHGPGSTTGRPSQCRRAKVWATKKNPGMESLFSKSRATPVKKERGHSIPLKLQHFCRLSEKRLPDYCLDSIQLLSKNRALHAES